MPDYLQQLQTLPESGFKNFSGKKKRANSNKKINEK